MNGDQRPMHTEYIGYMNAVYPQGATLDQRQQLQDAFMAGAVSAYNHMMNASELEPDDRTIQEMEILDAELENYAQSKMQGVFNPHDEN